MARERAATQEPPEGQDAEAPPQNGAAKMSKADAVRAALAEGIDSPQEGTAFIPKTFGIEMPRPTFSSYKSQEKARQDQKAGGTPARRGRTPTVAMSPRRPFPSRRATARPDWQSRSRRSSRWWTCWASPR